MSTVQRASTLTPVRAASIAPRARALALHANMPCTLRGRESSAAKAAPAGAATPWAPRPPCAPGPPRPRSNVLGPAWRRGPGNHHRNHPLKSRSGAVCEGGDDGDGDFPTPPTQTVRPRFDLAPRVTSMPTARRAGASRSSAVDKPRRRFGRALRVDGRCGAGRRLGAGPPNGFCSTACGSAVALPKPDWGHRGVTYRTGVKPGSKAPNAPRFCLGAFSASVEALSCFMVGGTGVEPVTS